jgi:hypothetical protein
VTACENIENRNHGLNPTVRVRLPDDYVGRHRMTEKRNPAIGIRKASSKIRDAANLVHQLLRRTIDPGHISRHWRRIAPVPLKVEADGDEAGSGKRQRIGLHQLPRSREPMRNDDSGRRGDVGALIDRDGCRSDRDMIYTQIQAGPLKLPDCKPDGQTADDGDKQASDTAPHFSIPLG